jgi:hypothetical protein
MLIVSFQKVKIVFDPKEQKKCPNGSWALYSESFDVAVVVGEEALDELLQKDEEEITDFFCEATNFL